MNEYANLSKLLRVSNIITGKLTERTLLPCKRFEPIFLIIKLMTELSASIFLLLTNNSPPFLVSLTHSSFRKKLTI